MTVNQQCGPPSTKSTTSQSVSNCDSTIDISDGDKPVVTSALSRGSFMSNRNSNAYESLDFDSAIQLTGYGPFHYKLVAVCALCLLNNGMHNGLSSYIFPAAQHNLDLSTTEIGYLNVSFLVGGVCSSFLWGALADLMGRRWVLLSTLLLDALTTISAALQAQFLGMCICRFINGFLIGAAGSITFNYISEFHAPEHRTKSICYSGIFYNSAWILLPVLSFFILPLPASALGGISGWRLFLGVVAIPELLAGVCLFCLPESPKYEAEKDRDKALTILRGMYAENLRCSADEFPVRQLKSAKGNSGMKIEDVMPDVVCVGKVRRVIGEMLSQIKRIFTRPLLNTTLLVSAIMFCNMFGYFGLGLWLPELFNRFAQYEELFPNATASVKDLATMQFAKNTTSAPDFDVKLFRTTLLIGISSLVGNFLSGWLSGKLALKVIPCVTMLIGGLSSGIIYWLRSSWQNLIVACIFQGAMATANIAIGSVVVELFPTKVAGMALCLNMFVGRVSGMLSNLMFGLLVDTQCAIPIFAVSVVLLIGTSICLLLPNPNASVSDTTRKLSIVISKQPINIAVISDEKHILH